MYRYWCLPMFLKKALHSVTTYKTFMCKHNAVKTSHLQTNIIFSVVWWINYVVFRFKFLVSAGIRYSKMSRLDQRWKLIAECTWTSSHFKIRPLLIFISSLLLIIILIIILNSATNITKHWLTPNVKFT